MAHGVYGGWQCCQRGSINSYDRRQLRDSLACLADSIIYRKLPFSRDFLFLLMRDFLGHDVPRF